MYRLAWPVQLAAHGSHGGSRGIANVIRELASGLGYSGKVLAGPPKDAFDLVKSNAGPPRSGDTILPHTYVTSDCGREPIVVHSYGCRAASEQ